MILTVLKHSIYIDFFELIMNIYIGNLAWKATEDDLKNLFGYFGTVTKAVVIRDRRSGRSKGFGFVELEDREQGQIAIDKLNNTIFMERSIIVNEARPQGSEDDSKDSAESSVNG